jgi:hypothetical protein
MDNKNSSKFSQRQLFIPVVISTTCFDPVDHHQFYEEHTNVHTVTVTIGAWGGVVVKALRY